MFKKAKTSVVLFFWIVASTYSFSQVKIGDNPALIDSNSILELESTDKVFVLTRLSNTQINALTPLAGALVYNTDTECIYAYDGVVWKNLCSEPNISISSTSPTENAIGDFWFDNTNSVVSIWNGTEWLPININPRRGDGPPITTLPNLVAGDIYVDQNNGDIYTYDGTDWVSLNQSVNANNGLSVTSDTLQLGGALIQPTIITTDSVNTLALQGLEETTLGNNNSIVVTDNTTGQLQSVPATNLIQQQQVVIIATDGQTQFSPPLAVADINKLDVYRNGVRIAFTLVDATTIEVEPEATCYAGDEIRIVQLN